MCIKRARRSQKLPTPRSMEKYNITRVRDCSVARAREGDAGQKAAEVGFEGDWPGLGHPHARERVWLYSTRWMRVGGRETDDDDANTLLTNTARGVRHGVEV
jgi:hypothetical protein